MKSEIIEILISVVLAFIPIILGIYLKKIYSSDKEIKKAQAIDRIVQLTVNATEQISKNEGLKDKF